MRCTIRDVLWLTVVTALACGWFFTTRRELRVIAAKRTKRGITGRKRNSMQTRG